MSGGSLADVVARLLPHVRLSLVSPQDVIKYVYPSKLYPTDQLFLVLAHHHLPQDFPLAVADPTPLVEFDPSKCSEGVELTAELQTACLVTEKNAGSVVLSRSSTATPGALVEVVVEKLRQPGYIGVGLCSTDISFKHIYCSSPSDRWIVYFTQKGQAKLFGPKINGTPYGKPIQEGDIIAVQIRDSGAVQFYHNGAELGLAMRDVPREWHLAIFLYYSGDRVTLR